KVCCIKGLGDLPDQRYRSRGLEPPLILEKAPQVRAVDVLHRQVQNAVLLAGPDRADRVSAVEACREPRFTQEPLPEALMLRELRRQHFQCNPLATRRVLREVNGAHRALAE